LTSSSSSPGPAAAGIGGADRPRILPQQEVTTADGVRLVTDVYLPAAGGAVPVVVHRTPYGRSAPYLLRLALRLGREGLGVVLQDCRGRNASQGEADWRSEADDGRDTLAWLAEQPWCDGRVGLLGISISALPLFTLAAGDTGDVDVRALVNVSGAADLRSFFYRGGALVLHWALPWLHLTGRRETVRGLEPDVPWDRLYRHLPLADLPPTEGFDAGLWHDVVAEPEGGSAWRGLDDGDRLSGLATATLHVGGWSDFLLPATLDTWRRSAGGDGGSGGDATLVIGPWDHSSLFADAALPELLAAWYAARLLDGEPPAAGRRDGPKVLLRLEGEDGWRGYATFPPPASHPLDLYLAPGAAGDPATAAGRLAETPPPPTATADFVYDPTDPVPTDGGPVWPFAAAGLQPGPADASAVEARDDVLVFTGEPLADDLWVAGPVSVELWVASSAAATDFTARLIDVDAAGTPRVVQDGILRLRSEPDATDEATGARRIVVDLAAAGHLFRRGHRVRTELSSSNFPKYDRHLNTGGVPGLTATPVPARQRVFFGGATASRLRLTVLDADAEAASGATPADVLRGRENRLRAARPSRRRRALAPLAAAGRRLTAAVEAQTARPTGFAGHVVGWLLLLVNPRLNRWTLEPLHVGRRDRVLEIGFGPGATIRRLARRAREGRVAGIDHSPVMVSQARRRNARAVRQGRVELHQGEVSRLPFPGDHFDAVVAVNSVQLWKHPESDLAEVHRVLRPGGRLALSLGQPRWTLGESAIRAASRRLVGQLAATGLTVVAVEVRRLGLLRAFRVVARKAADEAG